MGNIKQINIINFTNYFFDNIILKALSQAY